MKKFIILLIAVMLMMGAAPIQAENKTGTATTKTEQVTNQDQNPVVGKDKKGRTIHQGKKGGLYYWTTTKKGENAGKVRKGYLTKTEREEFYKSHPQVKRPTNN